MARLRATVVYALAVLSIVGFVSSASVEVTDWNTDFIKVEWNVTELPTTVGYKVSFEGGSSNFISKDELNITTNTSTIVGLEISTEYEICVIALANASVASASDKKECIKAKTIDAIRTDSILVLLLLVLYVVLCFVVGWLVWRHKKKQHDAGEAQKGKSDLENNSYIKDIEEDDSSFTHGRYVRRGSRPLSMTNL